MSRGAQVFRQTDATKLARAVQKAGLEIDRIEVSQDGKIVVIPRRPDGVVGEGAAAGNEWDNV